MAPSSATTQHEGTEHRHNHMRALGRPASFIDGQLRPFSLPLPLPEAHPRTPRGLHHGVNIVPWLCYRQAHRPQARRGVGVVLLSPVHRFLSCNPFYLRKYGNAQSGNRRLREPHAFNKKTKRLSPALEVRCRHAGPPPWPPGPLWPP